VTVADWRPIDLPPPMRAAPASMLAATNAQASSAVQKFLIASFPPL
jgi:hypothetical protein